MARPFTILSLAGGGAKGVFQACYLELVAARSSAPLRTNFDLIAATSTGAIVGLAVASEIDPARTSRLFLDHAEKVFQPRVGGIWRRGGRFDLGVLKELLDREFGDRRLGDLTSQVMVAVSGIDSFQGRFLTNADSDVRVAEAAIASSAAPTYFPPAFLDGHHRGFMDGGLWANDPSFFAIHEAMTQQGIDPSTIALLAIGTGSVPRGGRPREIARRATANAATLRFLFEATTSLQAWSAEYLCDQTLDPSQVLRVNPVLRDWIGLSDARKAVSLLPALAENAFESTVSRIQGLIAGTWPKASARISASEPMFAGDVREYGNRALELLRAMEAPAARAIVNTGGSTIGSFVIDALREHDQLKLELAFFDSESEEKRWTPPHWPAKVPINVSRVLALARPQQTVTCRLYDCTPSMTGVMIGDDHLFIGWTAWDGATGRLVDGAIPHVHYRRNAQTQYWFDLFASWIDGPMTRPALDDERGKR